MLLQNDTISPTYDLKCSLRFYAVILKSQNQQESGNGLDGGRRGRRTRHLLKHRIRRLRHVHRPTRGVIALGLRRPLAPGGVLSCLLLASIDLRARPPAVGQDDARRGRHLRQGQGGRGRLRRLMRLGGNPLETRIAGHRQVLIVNWKDRADGKYAMYCMFEHRGLKSVFSFSPGFYVYYGTYIFDSVRTRL